MYSIVHSADTSGIYATWLVLAQDAPSSDLL